MADTIRCWGINSSFVRRSPEFIRMNLSFVFALLQPGRSNSSSASVLLRPIQIDLFFSSVI